MTRLLAYLRCSTEMQVESGLGLDAQRERIYAYCAAMGFEVAGMESDEGISGAVRPAIRPGFAKILRLLRAKKADGIIALKLDRLSRCTKDVLELVTLAEAQDWRIVSVCESLDTKSASGRLVVTILSAFAEFERGVIGERTKAAMDQLRRQGKRNSGRPRFGYRFDGDAVVIVNEEQVTLGRMTELAALGYSSPMIAERLWAEGFKNPRSATGKFTDVAIRGILRTAKKNSV